MIQQEECVFTCTPSRLVSILNELTSLAVYKEWINKFGTANIRFEGGEKNYTLLDACIIKAQHTKIVRYLMQAGLNPKYTPGCVLSMLALPHMWEVVPEIIRNGAHTDGVLHKLWGVNGASKHWLECIEATLEMGGYDPAIEGDALKRTWRIIGDCPGEQYPYLTSLLIMRRLQA